MNNTPLKVKTTCSYCGVGCGIEVEKLPDGKLLLSGDKDHPANRGKLCSKGMNLHYVVEKKEDRILYPQLRSARDAAFQRVSWDMALDKIAAVFKENIEKFGPDSVAFYVSGQCLTEEYYVANKLTKAGIGTNNIDTNSRLCMSSAVVGYKKTLGEDSVPVSYEDIDLCDTIFISGANPAWCHPIIFRRIEERKAAFPDLKIIVADPRVTQSCALADIHLQLTPGSDTILTNAIGRCIIEDGNADLHFIENFADGYDEYKETVFKTSIGEAASICGVSENLIRETARIIGTSKGYISMWAMGLNQSSEGVNKNVSLINLSLITGQIGKPGAGPFSLTGQPNAMGGREVGGMCNLLPAHRDLSNPLHREEVARFWNVDSVPAKPGLSATEMIEALDAGTLKVIWIICTNPAVSIPHSRLVDKAMEKASFVVVQDISYSSDSVQYADVVLPAAGWLEKDGTMTNSDRRINLVKKLVDAPGEARTDTDILCAFAKKMNYPGFDFVDEESVFNEHKALTKNTNMDISGLTYQHLRENGSAQWPFPEGATEGTVRLFTDNRFFTPNKKAKIVSVAGMERIEALTPDFPLILTTGRIRDQWHTMTRTGKVQKLNKHISKPYLEIHPTDATMRGINDNDPVEIWSQQGNVSVCAQITESIKPGVVFLPMHWGKVLQKDFSRSNNITKMVIDPVSKEPDFKFTAVEVKKYVKPTEKIIVVGSGAAAFSFIKHHRELNRNDDIHVFSDEQDLFYNRILLPDYICDEMEWEKLASVTPEEISGLHIHTYPLTRVVKVLPDSKSVLDIHGVVHNYDKLVLATGCRSNVPDGVNTNIEGVFKIRDRSDAEYLRSFVSKDDEILVVGAGLLGLEIAGALQHMGIRACIVNRGDTLMRRQLDKTAANLLNRIIKERGIAHQINDSIVSFSKQDNGLLNVVFESGATRVVKAIVYAIGTIPNIELGIDAGLKFKNGLLVDEFLTTSNKDIYAIGEIAEYKGSMWGIRSAAEAQGRSLALCLNGNMQEYYTGSVSMNILKLPGLDLISIGDPVVPGGDDSFEEVIMLDNTQKYYKKCVIKDDILVGAILLGDKAEFIEFKTLIESKTELSEKRNKLLRGGGTAVPVLGKLVCSCNNVGTGNLEKEIHAGCNNLDELLKKTGAGMGCGSCKPEVKVLLEKALIPG